MEKLIELLNAWERERVNHNTKEFIPYGESSFSNLTVERITSKKYGFIKWLVENNKIDERKCWDASFELYHTSYTKYESLLMLLSIQDEPVKFLSEIVKDE